MAASTEVIEENQGTHSDALTESNFFDDDSDLESYANTLLSSPSVEPKDTASPSLTTKKKRESVLFKAKKNLGGKAATSSLGKQVLKKLLDEESLELMNVMKELIGMQFGKKYATDLENIFIKMMMKIQFQVDKRSISLMTFRPAEVPLRKALRRLVSIKRRNLELQNHPRELEAHFLKVHKHIMAVGQIVIEPMQPYLTQKNTQLFHNAMQQISSTDLWKKAFADPNSKDIITNLCKVMNRYIFRL